MISEKLVELIGTPTANDMKQLKSICNAYRALWNADQTNPSFSGTKFVDDSWTLSFQTDGYVLASAWDQYKNLLLAKLVKTLSRHPITFMHTETDHNYIRIFV
jgi:hypothetical protein